jgi:hypothetical protein
MKNIILGLILFLSGGFMTKANAITHYTLKEGKLHKSGKIDVEVKTYEKTMIVNLNYDIDKKALVPIPSKVLKGKKDFEVPLIFKDEQGYLELERLGFMETEKAFIKFIGRVNLGELTNAYSFEILPKNGKSKLEGVYHPTLPGIGWKYLKLKFLGNIPLLNGYETIAYLK